MKFVIYLMFICSSTPFRDPTPRLLLLSYSLLQCPTLPHEHPLKLHFRRQKPSKSTPSTTTELLTSDPQLANSTLSPRPSNKTMPYPTPITPQTTRIGWIGIGVMGSPMASLLLQAGYTLTVYTRTLSKATPLLTLGATLSTSPSDVATSSDIIFTMVGHPSDVRTLILGDDHDHGLLHSLSPNTVLVDHTSSCPALAREIHKAARGRQCHAVDAPVSGGDVGAKEGKLTIFCGGDAEVVAWVRPLLEIMASKVTHMGGPGTGQSCKIGNQIVVGANLLGLSEGMVFARRSGLDVRKWMVGVRSGAGGSKVMEIFGERMIGREFGPGGFVEYMVKDMGMGVNYVEEGEDNKEVVVLPGAALVKQMFESMVANGDGKMGTQGLITAVERINGM